MLLRQCFPDVLCERADDSADEAGDDGEDFDVPESFLSPGVLVELVDDDFSDGEQGVSHSSGHCACQYSICQLPEQLDEFAVSLRVGTVEDGYE